MMLVAVAGPVAAQEVVPEHFRHLAPLVGSCWRGAFPDGGQTDEHCFEWVYGTTYIRDHHVVRGGETDYQGETLFAWDVERQIVVYWYWSSAGGVSTGSVQVAGAELRFPDEVHRQDGATRTFRSVWRMIDADRYLAITEEQTDQVWDELWRVELRRVRPAR
jgi:hypothetical protein